jgi:hypothetical protein
MSSNYRQPILRFKLIDNPYNSFLNKFKLNYFFPINLYLSQQNKVVIYSMFGCYRDFSKFSNQIPYKPDYFISQINTLLKRYTNNNQTLKLDQRTLSIDYIKPFLIPSEKLPNLNIIPESDILSEYKNISDYDIHTYFELSNNNNHINFPVYNKIG